MALAKLAALLPAALVSRLGPAETARCARRNDLSAIDAETILKRDAPAAGIERVAEARVPLADAEDARLIAFRPSDGGVEHLADRHRPARCGGAGAGSAALRMLYR